MFGVQPRVVTLSVPASVAAPVIASMSEAAWVHGVGAVAIAAGPSLRVSAPFGVCV